MSRQSTHEYLDATFLWSSAVERPRIFQLRRPSRLAADSARWRSRRGRRLVFEPLEQRQLLATITVTSLADNLHVDGQVTLREAVRAAEFNISVDGSVAGSGADTIQFAGVLSGDVDLLLVGDTTLGPSALAITTAVTIRGNAAGITVQRSAIGPPMRLIRVAASGDLTLENITLAGGLLQAQDGILPDGAGGDARGGAIFNQGTLRIHSSTLARNEAHGGNGAGSGQGGSASGGAIYNDGGVTSVINATVSGNAAQSGSGSQTPSSLGGGILSRNGTLQIYNSTITGNTSTSNRSVFVLGDAGTAAVEIFSSIIGQAISSPTVFDLGINAENGGILTVFGANNIIRRQNDFPEITVSNADPLLGPLLDNGGSSPTHALLEGSPAINVGSNPLSLSTDQRGAAHARVVGAVADIGAFEVQSTAGPPLPGDYNGNRTVDAADYVVWRKTLGSQVNRFEGADGNGNNSIDVGDFNVWRSNFGRMLGGASIIAPSLVDEVVGAPPGDQDFPGLNQVAAPAVGKPNSGRSNLFVESRQQATTDDDIGLIVALVQPIEDSANDEHSRLLLTSTAADRIGDNAPNGGWIAGSTSSSLRDAVWADWPSALGRI
jgi:hypothetical protein